MPQCIRKCYARFNLQVSERKIRLSKRIRSRAVGAHLVQNSLGKHPLCIIECG